MVEPKLQKKLAKHMPMNSGCRKGKQDSIGMSFISDSLPVGFMIIPQTQRFKAIPARTSIAPRQAKVTIK
uniref:Uncharacterized protein n=1 Tax=Arion vulgaris TaxID=1028688 RepID=A0A0B7A688_9EUPU